MSTGFAIVNAHVLPIEGETFDGTVVVADGRIAALGADVTVPAGIEVVDARGRWLLPGFVDAHTHLGVHEEGEGWAGSDTNELTDPVTAGVRALDAINPVELGFDDALAGGVTAVNVNPGSGNPIGGLTVAIHTHGRTVDEMVLRSPSGLKSALGENPKRVYGDRKQSPSTRLGTASVIRERVRRGPELSRQAGPRRARQGSAGAGSEAGGARIGAATRDPVAAALPPRRRHRHRDSDRRRVRLRVGHRPRHRGAPDRRSVGRQGYSGADRAALHRPGRRSSCGTARWPIPGRLAAAGVEISIITDHPVVPINFLVHQATLAVKEGLDPVVALRAITIHPARVMGVADRIGSLDVGKDADLVLWSGDPLDVMSRASGCLHRWPRRSTPTISEARVGTVTPR